MIIYIILFLLLSHAPPHHNPTSLPHSLSLSLYLSQYLLTPTQHSSRLQSNFHPAQCSTSMSNLYLPQTSTGYFNNHADSYVEANSGYYVIMIRILLLRNPQYSPDIQVVFSLSIFFQSLQFSQKLILQYNSLQ